MHPQAWEVEIPHTFRQTTDSDNGSPTLYEGTFVTYNDTKLPFQSPPVEGLSRCDQIKRSSLLHTFMWERDCTDLESESSVGLCRLWSPPDSVPQWPDSVTESQVTVWGWWRKTLFTDQGIPQLLLGWKVDYTFSCICQGRWPLMHECSYHCNLGWKVRGPHSFLPPLHPTKAMPYIAHEM